MQNSAVHHKLYGRGIVCEQSGKTIRVHFEGAGDKSFVYPDAFASHLRFADEVLQAETEKMLADAAAQAAAHAAQRAAERAAAMEEEKKHQKELAAARRKSAARTRRKSPAHAEPEASA